RGNVTFGMEAYDRKAAYERNRDFYTDSWSDPTVGGDFFVFGYNGFNTAFTFSPPSTAVLDALFTGRPTYTSGPAAGMQTGVRAFTDLGFPLGIFEGFRFNQDGSLFATGTGNNLWKYLEGGGQVDNYEFALQQAYDTTIGVGPDQTFGQVMDTLKWNNTDAYVSSPQKRYSIFASGNYDINDSMQFWARGTWAESKTRTRLFPANASYGWEALIPYNPATDSPLDPSLNYSDPATLNAIAAAIRAGDYSAYANPGFQPSGTPDPDGVYGDLDAVPGNIAYHPVTPEFALLLNSRTNAFSGLSAAATPWILETYPRNSFDDRSTVNVNSAWQLDSGLTFDLPFGDWSGDVSLSHGEFNKIGRAHV